MFFHDGLRFIGFRLLHCRTGEIKTVCCNFILRNEKRKSDSCLFLSLNVIFSAKQSVQSNRTLVFYFDFYFDRITTFGLFLQKFLWCNIFVDLEKQGKMGLTRKSVFYSGLRLSGVRDEKKKERKKFGEKKNILLCIILLIFHFLSS